MNKSDLRALLLRLGAIAALGALGACASLDSTLESARGLLSPSAAPAAQPAPEAGAQDANKAAPGQAGQPQTPPAAAQPLRQKPGGPIIARQVEEQPGTGEKAPRQPDRAQPAPAAQPAAAPAARPAEPAPAAKPAEPAPANAQSAAQPAAQPSAAAGEGGDKPAGEASADGQSSGEPGPDGRRVISVPKGGGAGADIKRRLDSLIGGTSSTSAIIDSKVKQSDIVGNWKLDEEDGLRTCVVTLAPPDKGGTISAVEGCSGLAVEVTSWGMFGEDLLLRDKDNTVRARLRQSENGWVGFTLDTGIPLVMSRAG